MRWELLSAFRDKVEQVSGVYTDVWNGVDHAFNIQEKWPAVFVAYEGCSYEILEELGVTTWERAFRLGVYVCARSTEEALSLLDKLEQGLTGEQISPDVSPLEPSVDEELIAAELDFLLYGQSYECKELQSKY